MLKLRVISAIVMAAIVVAALLLLNTSQLGLFLGVLMMICAWEWAGLLNIEGSHRPFSMLRLSFPVLVAYILYGLTLSGGLSSVIWLGGWGWALALIWMWKPDFARKGTINNALLKGIVGLWVLVPTWAALMYFHSYEHGGAELVFYVMAITWVADIGAFFTGRRFGKVKLAPKLSPAKTREGVYGALVAVAVYSAIFGWVISYAGFTPLEFILLSLLTALFSVAGDLFESMFKRHAEVKDSSQLIPGHGGFLDRVDSLLAAAPVFALGMIYL